VNASIRLLAAQLVYRRTPLLVVLGAITAFFAVLMLLRVEGDDVIELASILAFLAGGALGVHAWVIDAKERRIRLQCMLPVSRPAIAGARLLGAASIQLLVAIPTVGAVAATAEPAAMAERLSTVYAANLWSLAIALSCYFLEEVNVALSRWRALLWIVNVAPVVVALWLVVATAFDPEILFDSPAAPPIAALTCAVFASATILLFASRRSLDVGISPLHGFPVDWRE